MEITEKVMLKNANTTVSQSGPVLLTYEAHKPETESLIEQLLKTGNYFGAFIRESNSNKFNKNEKKQFFTLSIASVSVSLPEKKTVRE